MKRYTFRHTKVLKPCEKPLLLGQLGQVRVLFPLLEKLHRNVRLFLWNKISPTSTK